MRSSSTKKVPSKTGGRSGSGSQSGSNREPGLSSRSTDSEPQENVDLSQWSPWLLNQQYQRSYRERKLPDGRWDFQWSGKEAQDVPRTKPDSSFADAGQDPDEQANDSYDGDLPSYKLSPRHENPRGGYFDSSSAPVYQPMYQTPIATGPGLSMNTGLEPISEQFNSFNISAPLTNNAPSMGSMVDEFGVPITNAVPSYQAQPRSRGSYTQGRFEKPPAERMNDDLQSNLSQAQSQVISNETRGLKGDAARAAALDPDLKVHPGNDFKFGRVFKIYWTEPMGQGGARPDKNGTERVEIKLQYGEVCYATIRRFIIVRVMEGHCQCLPILTYGRQATTKRGVKPQDHAIIYTTEDKKGKPKSKPTKTDGEEDLRNSPIRIVPKTPRDKLDPCSRLNYAKIYTVEYNVKVCFVGSIHDKSVKYFQRDFNHINEPLPQNPDTEYSDDDAQGEARLSNTMPYENAQRGGKQGRN